MSWTEASTNMLTTTVLSDETRGRESLTVKTRLRSTTHGSDNIIHKSTCHVYKSTARRRNNELPSSMLTSTINKRLSRRKSPHHPSYKGHITTFAIFFMLMLTDKCLAMSAKYKVPLIISDATEQSGYKTSLQDEEQMVTLRTAIPISNTVSVEDLDFQSVTYIPKWGDDVTDVLLISGRDHVYMINNTIIPESGQIKIVERLTWRTDDRLKGECQLMGKKTRQNFNAPEGQNSVKLYEERCKDANCPAPQNPTMRSVSLYANTSSGYQLFSALVYDFMGRQPTLTKRKIMSDEGMVTTDDLWFNEPDFIKAVEYGDKVYLFFREVAKEFESGSPRDVVYGRVAQVCRDDIGRLDKPHRWSTFLKARITCNPEGDTLQFNNLTAVSDIQKVIGEDGREVDVVFATFTTPWGWSDVSVSAVCMFPLQESIESVFTNGQFLQKVNLDTDDPDLVYMDAKYQAVPVQPRHVPIPRPGECGVQYTQKGLDFSDEHPLMYDAIYPAFKRPIFVTEADTRVTEIAVDDEAGDTQKVMMYLGTENGQLLKIRTRIGITDGAKAICIEKSGMANKEQCPKDMCGIQKLNITRTVYGPAALIAFSAYVVHVPLAKCDNLPDRCCNLIPDCGWSFENSRCEVRTPLNTMDLEPTLRDDEEWPTSCKLVLPPESTFKPSVVIQSHVTNDESSTGSKKIISTAGSSKFGIYIGCCLAGFIFGATLMFLVMRRRSKSKQRKHSHPESTCSTELVNSSNVKSKIYRGSLDEIDGDPIKKTKTPTKRPTNLDPMKPDSTKYNFNLPTPSPDRENFNAFDELNTSKPEKHNLYADLPTPKEEKTTLLSQMEQENEVKVIKKQQEIKPSNPNKNNSNNQTTPPLPLKAKERREETIKKPQRQASFSAFEDRKRPKPPVPVKPSTLNRAVSMQVKPYMGNPISPRRPYINNRSNKLVAAAIPLVPNMETEKFTEV